MKFHRLISRGLASLKPVSVTRSLTSSAGILSCDIEDIAIPDLTWSQMCFSRIDSLSANTALVDGVSGKSFSLAEVRDLSRRLASGLLRLGCEPGDVVAAVLPNCPEYAILFMAASEAGLVLTTLNPVYTPGEIRGQLTNSEARVVVTSHKLIDKVQEAIAGTDIRTVVMGDTFGVIGDMAFHNLLADKGDLVTDGLTKPEDIAVLPYSSGTTGVPKGVQLTHRNLVSNMLQRNHPLMEGMDIGEVTVCILPMFHIFAMNVTMADMLWHGGKLVTLPMFEPRMFLEALSRHRPTFLHLAPPLVQFLAVHPMVTADHLASLHTIFVGAAPAGQALITLFHKKAPNVRFREGYGMTEASPVVTFTRGDLVDTKGASGQLMPNMKMKVTHPETGEILGVGETGELCFQGPNIMPGYFKNEKATAETIIDDWLHSGDIGYCDEQGIVYLVDRKKELIKVKGLQVAPAELEDLIRGLAGVRDVAVIGIPDQRAGEAPRAYVVREDEAAVTEAGVRAHVEAGLSRHKHLTGGVEFIAEIPKSAAGKILRKDLKAAYLASTQQ